MASGRQRMNIRRAVRRLRIVDWGLRIFILLICSVSVAGTPTHEDYGNTNYHGVNTWLSGSALTINSGVTTSVPDPVRDLNIANKHCVEMQIGGGGAVTSVFGRTGVVAAQTGDYTAAQVTNSVSTAGSYADPSWITSLVWSKISSTPTTLSGYGITDAVGGN